MGTQEQQMPKAKILEMPKSNQQMWDDLFKGFQNQIDRRISLLARTQSSDECAPGLVGEDGGWIPADDGGEFDA